MWTRVRGGSRAVHEGGDEGGHNENAGSGRWLLTYADMITLLMIFFIVLYAFSTTDQRKYREIAMSLQAALAGAPLQRGLPQSTANALVQMAPHPAATPKIGPDPASRQLAQMQSRIQAVLQAGKVRQVTLHRSAQALDIRFEGSSVYFASASARLKPRFKQVLRSLAPVLKQSPGAIHIQGFTNDLPLRSRRYPTAWELSAARAVHVTRYLTEFCGLSPHMVDAEAYGQWHPLYPNDSKQNLALNRSVDIVVTTQQPLGLNQGGPDVAPPGSRL